MCLSLYALLLRTLVIDLHAKKSAHLQGCRKVWKTVLSVKFSKCKTRNFTKNYCGAKKLQLDL